MSKQKKPDENPLLDLIQERLRQRIEQALEKPDKNQRGIANTIRKKDSQVTLLMRGDRKLSAAEFFLVFDYLGEPLPTLRDLGIKVPKTDSKRLANRRSK